MVIYLSQIESGKGQENIISRQEVPYQIVIIPSEKAKDFVGKNLKEAFVQMSVEDFEKIKKSLVKNKSKVENTPDTTEPAILSQAIYKAQWKENHLQGKAEWLFNTRASGMSYFPVQPLNLAIKKASWNGNEALLGEFFPNITGLIIPADNRQTLGIEWSIKAEQTPDGYQIGIKIPPAILQTMELEIPAEWNYLLSSKGSIESQFLPDNNAKKILRISAGGESKIDLLLQDPSQHKSISRLTVQNLHSIHSVAPAITNSEFLLVLEGITNGSKKLEFEIPLDMKVLDVIAEQIESWKINLAADVATLELTLKSNLCRPDKIQIKTLTNSVISKSTTWQTPWLKIKNLPSHREEISISFKPGIIIEDLMPKDFLLADTRRKDAQDFTIGLIGGGLVLQKNKSYPILKLSMGNALFHVEQETLFQPTLSGANLQTNIFYHLLSGSLSSLLVQLPSGWDVDQLSFSSDTQIKDWSVLQNQEKSLLRIELESPLVFNLTGVINSKPPMLTLRLVPIIKTKRNFFWGLPSVVPINSLMNEGYFGIAYDASVFSANVSADINEIEGKNVGNLFKQNANHLFRYVGNSPLGSVELKPVAGTFRTKTASQISFKKEKIVTEMEMALSLENGTVETFDLICPKGSNPNFWKWSAVNLTNPIKKTEKVASYEIATFVSEILTSHNLFQACITDLLPQTEYWRFYLSHPLNHKEPLNLKCNFDTKLISNSNEIPLICFLPSQQVDAKVYVEVPRNRKIELRSKGLKPIPSSNPRTRVFEFDSPLPWLGDNNLVSEVPENLNTGVIKSAVLNKTLLSNLTIRNNLKLSLIDWDNDFLDIHLPANSILLEAKVDSKLISNFIIKENLLRITIPAQFANSHKVNQIAITYQENFSDGWLGKIVPVNFPIFPVLPEEKKLLWVLPPGLSPSSNLGMKLIAGNKLSDTPMFLFPSHYLTRKWHSSMLDINGVDELVKGVIEKSSTVDLGEKEKFYDLVRALHSNLLEENYSLIIDLGSTEILNLNYGSKLILPKGSIAENLKNLKLKLVQVSNFIVMTGETSPLFKSTENYNLNNAPDLLLQAFNQGMDSTKQFISGWKWLCNLDAKSDPLESTLEDQQTRINWTRWEATTTSETLILIDDNQINIFGIVVGFFLLLIVMKWKSRFARILEFILVLVSGLGLCWLPVPYLPLIWWFFLGWVVKNIWDYIGVFLGPVVAILPIKLINLTVKIGTVILTVSLVLNGIKAEEPKLFNIYLLLAPEDSNQESIYLVPDAFIKKLKENKENPPLGKAIILSGIYEGSSVDNTLIFNAQWNIYSSGPSDLALPNLEGLLPDKIFLNDQPAYPLTGNNGLISIAIPRSGMHKLRAVIKVGVGEKNLERFATFNLPSAVINSFQCELPANAEQAILMGTLGGVEVIKAGSRSRVISDLGKINAPFTLRWFRGPLAPKAKPSIQEAYLWDIALDSCKLEAFWNLQIPEVGTDLFEVDLPVGIMPFKIDAIRLGDSSSVNVSGWTLKPMNQNQRLSLQFSRRISGNIKISGIFISTTGASGRWQLPVPTPVGDFIEGSSFLGYKTISCNATRTVLPLRVTGIESKNFAPFWNSNIKPDPESLSYVCSFRREINNLPVLTLDITPMQSKLIVNQTIKAEVHPQFNQYAIQANLQSDKSDILFIEWYLNGAGKYLVTKLQGEGLRSWSQKGEKILIWVEKPSRKVSFSAELIEPVIKSKIPLNIKIPRSFFAETNTINTDITINHNNNVKLKPTQLIGFKNAEGLILKTQDLNYQAQFEIIPVLANGKASFLFWNEEKDGLSRARLEVEIDKQKEGSSHYELNIEGWNTAELKLDVPPNIKVEAVKTIGNNKKLLIEIDPNKKGVFAFTISCDITNQLLNLRSKIPYWNIIGAESSANWIGFNSEEHTVTNAQALLKAIGPIGLPSFNLKKMMSNGTYDFYKIKDTAKTDARSWPASLTRINRLPSGSDLHFVVHQIIEVQPEKDGSCKGSSVYWVYLPTPAALKVNYVTALKMPIFYLDDEQMYSDVEEKKGNYTLQVSKAGFHRIKIDWNNVVQPRTVTELKAIAPVLFSKNNFETTLIMGKLSGESWQVQGMPVFSQELSALESQARSLANVSRIIAEENKGNAQDQSSLVMAQELFFHYLNSAKELAELTSKDQEKQAWLEEVRESNLKDSVEYKYEEIKVKAESNSKRRNNYPAWIVASKVSNPRIFVYSAEDEHLDLSRVLGNDKRFQFAPIVSLLWLLSLIVIFYVKEHPKFHKFIIGLWPEQFLFSALVGIMFFGIIPLVILSLIIGVVGRSYYFYILKKNQTLGLKP